MLIEVLNFRLTCTFAEQNVNLAIQLNRMLVDWKICGTRKNQKSLCQVCGNRNNLFVCYWYKKDARVLAWTRM